jgi:hypothetical protein
MVMEQVEFAPKIETILEILAEKDLDFMIEELYRQLQDGIGEGQPS